MERIATTRKQRLDILLRCQLFEGLDPKSIEPLVEKTTVREYARDETIFLSGRPADGFHIISTGQAKIHRVSADGREQILHICGPGDACGEVAVFQGGDFPATMVALEKTKTLFLSRAAFLDTAKRAPDMLLEMLTLLSRRLRYFVQLVEDLSLKSVNERLAKYIIDNSETIKDKTVCKLDCSKTSLAARLGAKPETLSRSLKKFQDDGIIAVTGRTFRVLDFNALSDASSELR